MAELFEGNLGPVVQNLNVVIVTDSLGPLVHIKLSVLVIFAEKN